MYEGWREYPIPLLTHAVSIRFWTHIAVVSVCSLTVFPLFFLRCGQRGIAAQWCALFCLLAGGARSCLTRTLRYCSQLTRFALLDLVRSATITRRSCI